jgi:hypothetical protein
MNLLSLVGPRLDNICQIRRKWYYLSGSLFLQSKQALRIRKRSVMVDFSLENQKAINHPPNNVLLEGNAKVPF